MMELQPILMDMSTGKVCRTEMLSKRKYKMVNFNNYTNKNKTKHNPKWSYGLLRPNPGA